jgi:hypothetical protein
MGWRVVGSFPDLSQLRKVSGETPRSSAASFMVRNFPDIDEVITFYSIYECLVSLVFHILKSDIMNGINFKEICFQTRKFA